MSEIKPRSGRRLKHRLLAIDAFVDTAAWTVARGFGRAWTVANDHLSRLTVRGWKRATAELASEAATLGVAGSVVLLAAAIPAFRATEGDWRARSEYAVTFLDRNGATLGRRGIFLDDSVPLDDLPPYLIQATLATEDRRFFDHFGIDVIGTFRAVASNAKAGGVVQGGSTLTQQLAKNLFLSNERTIDRKIKEAFLALWLEANLSKREILKLYLDHAYMGGGTHGVAAASQFYFGKSVKDLTLAEAAMLSGLYKAPTKYAPHVNLANARARANQVLTNMVDAGFVTEGQVAAARRSPATPVATVAAGPAPDWFLDWAFDEVKRLAPADHTITVRTTLDPGVQRAAEDAIVANLRQHGQDYRVSQGATVVSGLDGAVRAMVGGRDYGESVFNRAVDALRQPGSSFKPFVYATAFMNGYSVDSVVPDAPITIGNWSPRNYGRSYAGKVTLKTALARSINTIPVRLAQAIGRDHIVDTAHRLGIGTELKITRALPLGVAEVTVLDMTTAYAAFANGGLRAAPYAIETVSSRDGRVLYDHGRDAPAPERVLPEEVASEMNVALNAVVEAGTGGKARLEGQVAAGKTGTTQSYRDAWFVGFTGWYSAAMWFGNDDYGTTNNMTGGSLPALTWHDMMAKIHEGLPYKALPGVGHDAPAVADAAPAPAAGTGRDADPNRLTPAALSAVAAAADAMRARLDPTGDPLGPSVLLPRPGGGVVELGDDPALKSAARLDTMRFVGGEETTASVR
ncbi:transglycosylase domain-containing protein [Oharaeibacter diazotrophicus]|uniref:Penicillin-binding protein 1A n=2 Tax=Oharaeibacter diazotrophicus TaxID=1920512 RepID=A0A4R6RB10_9HYPH|nr:PBP1A family penicillin-binding protein [Oharaeibacter diazotrophicus]TDP83232.1 penicillin-binding protein 1A [Oharaeibacter diazotrophicus]BBE72065.1 penicillin-binding protein 2D [Pleomorphomonas sp. SM30]GLS78830.1 penicillin-binding protein [Oharaeibacter diazotrophicus]